MEDEIEEDVDFFDRTSACRSGYSAAIGTAAGLLAKGAKRGKASGIVVQLPAGGVLVNNVAPAALVAINGTASNTASGVMTAEVLEARIIDIERRIAEASKEAVAVASDRCVSCF
jgi:hypothetical protein